VWYEARNTAAALQGRPLVELSKRRGTWSADSAGWRRLPREIYPPGLWAKKRTAVEVDEATLNGAQKSGRTSSAELAG
jgi:hypothetical protein